MSTQKSPMQLRSLGNLCSSAVYNHGQLTLVYTISCGLQSKAANNWVNTAGT